VLDEYEAGDRYINLALGAHSLDTLTAEERAQLTALVYTAVEHKLTYDYIIAALASRELSRIDPHTLNILRIGTSGAIQPEIPLGGFVFSHISVGCDGLMNWYADRDKIAMLDIEEAFKKHTGWNRHLPDPYFVKAGEKMSELFRDCTYPGMTIAASGFYGPQGRVLRMPLAMPDMLDTFESFRFGDDLKVTNFEMEGSAIAGIAAHLGHNAGTVCCIIAHRHHKASNPDYKPQVRKLIELCLEKLAE
jgi:uridine phosphorylase